MYSRREAVSDVLEELSNEEIRRRLILYGGPNLPVTEQTRARLLDVLREYIDKPQQHNVSKSNSSDESKSSNNASRNNDTRLQSSTNASTSNTNSAAAGDLIDVPLHIIAYSGAILILSVFVYYLLYLF
uniref:LEM domain-containing protein n=1 Tax=Anopheles coluzzii TaxID=1518534 RepID=A0A6E8W8U2_ANOCL